MNHWLIKSDPGDYSAHDLERDGTTRWDGVRNAVAQKHIKAMSRGDALFVYHSGKPKAIVATAKVASDPYADPDDKSGKLHVVDIRFDHWLKNPVSLADIKADDAFTDFPLVGMSRLSVMPVTAAHWKRLIKMSAQAGP